MKHYMIWIVLLGTIYLTYTTTETRAENLSGMQVVGAVSSARHKTIVVKPNEIEDPLVNPDCGWGIWLGPIFLLEPQRSVAGMTTAFGDDAPQFSFACIDWDWRFLEPREGEFHWDDLDAVVNYWIARGKQINMRLFTTYNPGWAGEGGTPVAPDWLFDEAGCRHFPVKFPLKGKTVGTIRAPEYTDPIYLKKIRNFLTAARDRYEHHSNDSFIMWHVGAYGPWGEWWVGHGEYEWPSDEAAHEACVKMQNIYKDLFGTKCQLSCRGDNLKTPPPPDYETWKYKDAMDEAAANGWVLGVHSCLWPGTRSGHYQGRLLLQDYWPSNVHYGESNWSYASMVRGEHGGLKNNLDGALRLHYNWLHQYMKAEDYRQHPNTAYFDRGLKKGGFGYRFVLTKVEYPERLAAGSTFTLKQSWVNRNTGRAWRKYPLAVYLTNPSSGQVVVGPLVDEDFDQTMFIAGETYQVSSQFTLPPDAPDDTYDLRIAMVDRSGVPRIRLAIEGGDAEKRYKIGLVRIKAPVR